MTIQDAYKIINNTIPKKKKYKISEAGAGGGEELTANYYLLIDFTGVSHITLSRNCLPGG